MGLRWVLAEDFVKLIANCGETRDSSRQSLGSVLATAAEERKAVVSKMVEGILEAVVAELDDSDQGVRYRAVETLGKLEAGMLAQHVGVWSLPSST